MNIEEKKIIPMNIQKKKKNEIKAKNSDLQ